MKRRTSTGAPDLGDSARAPDPLGTSAIRAATISAWLSSPTRLREDANVEEDYARGYYRDRVVVELAQNAADAARALGSGGGGRLLLRLASDGGGPLLAAANTGAPLTAAGVLALASMRASSKTSSDPTAPSVGRFGVGFAAVRAVSDDIVIASRAGGVRFSAAAARALLVDLVAAHPSGQHGRDQGDPAEHDDARPGALEQDVRKALLQALDRPLADLPILRLPFPPDTPPTLPTGYDTIVAARLRGSGERDVVRRLLDEVDDALLLALPALVEVRVEVEGEPPRVLEKPLERWFTVHVEGQFDPADLADRPHEERGRTAWRLTWAVPGRSPGTEVRINGLHVLHAPTPTEEPCSLPALLVATFPLDPTRRHVAWGPATETLALRAGDAYGDLVERVAREGGDALDLVPLGLPAGRLDAALTSAALRSLTRRPILRPVAGASTEAPLLAPHVAQAVAGPVGHDLVALAALSPGVPDLVLVPRGADARARLRALGVEPRDLADIVDGLPTSLQLDQWLAIYDALTPHLSEPGVADALADLPVPLLDGRTVRGPRGVVVHESWPSPETHDVAAGPSMEAFAPWGLRVVDPRAAHPVLVRLGATPADARSLLDHPSIRAAVAAAAGRDMTDDAAAVASAVLELASAALAAGAEAEEVAAAHPWLGLLPLPDADGRPAPARELTLPGSWAESRLDGLGPAHDALVERHGGATLRAVGVRDGLVVVRVRDVVTDEGVELPVDEDAPEAVLEGWGDYLIELADCLGGGVYLGELAAVADLDAVARDAWPEVLAHVAADPPARAALLTPVRSGAGAAPSYTAWWLRGLLGAPFAAPGARAPFLRPAPPELGDEDEAARLGGDVLAALGAVTDLADLDAGEWDAYLANLPPVGTVIPLESALAVWRALAAAVADPHSDLALSPDRLPVLRSWAGGDGADSGDGASGADAHAVVAAAEDVVVGAEPMWGQVVDVMPAPAAVARALAVALDVRGAGEDEDVSVTPSGATEVPTLPEVLAVVPTAPSSYLECDDLVVDGVRVEWWVSDGRVLAATTAGLARGLAQAAGRWEARALVEAVLVEPGRAAALALESAWDRA